MHGRHKHARLKRITTLPLPESLERAFSEIEKPMVRYADAPEARTIAPIDLCITD